jgi:hypothetical protein
MGQAATEKPVEELLDKVLGHLNFSSGQHDPKFVANLDRLFRIEISASQDAGKPTAKPAAAVPGTADKDTAGTGILNGDQPSLSQPSAFLAKVNARLRSRLSQVKQSSDTFRDAVQVETILNLVFDDFVPAYILNHRDLLFHQTQDFIFNSFFLARVFETVMEKSAAGGSPQDIITESLGTVNDYLGHRPIAVLTSQKIEPYENEWVAPTPVYLSDVGTSVGRYERLIQKTVDILHSTDQNILNAAQFDPANLDQLCIDPRAFDFDHPVNKRPNHHFGTWDEHHVNNQGFYFRFIVHQVTLDSLLARVEQDQQTPEAQIDAEELLFEAAAALAGTMLMGSGISGNGPGAHDSTVTLGSLLPNIASYRDQFYLSLVEKVPDAHRARLKSESNSRKQVFGSVRQHLNAQLSNHRAYQLVNCRLASIFARMGHPVAAQEQSALVPVTASRISCQIDCLLSEANRAIKQGQLQDALEKFPKIEELMMRGIQCGAIVDPWNILGFDGNYSLFPALENSVRDHRVFDLVDLVECIFALYSRLWSEAAAIDDEAIINATREKFSKIVQWWRQFAAHEVMAVDAVDANEIFQASELVAEALRLWHIGGAETGDISFWAQHAELFDSPKAYTLVVDALIQRADYSTAMALLVHWLSQADQIGLQQGDSSFHNLAFRWIVEQKKLLLDQVENSTKPDGAKEAGSESDDDCDAPDGNDVASDNPTGEKADADKKANGVVDAPEVIWKRIRKFYDFVEANAESYWEIPQFDINRSVSTGHTAEAFMEEVDQLDLPDDDDEDQSLFSAAYDNMVFSDSADDGNEGEVFEGGFESDEALEAEVDRILNRLEFLGTIASYWRIAATIPLPVDRQNGVPRPSSEVEARLRQRLETVGGWLNQAQRNYTQLMDLCDSINNYNITLSGTDQDSMMQYDQSMVYKESLVNQAILTCVECENAVHALQGVTRAITILLAPEENALQQLTLAEPGSIDALAETYAGILLRDTDRILTTFDELVEYFSQRSTLYVPLSKNGSPREIVEARATQTAMLDLLRSLPDLGLIVPTYELTRTALDMERNQPSLPGAVTEYDEIFEVAFTSMVKALTQSIASYQTYLRGTDRPENEVADQSESVLFDCVEMLTESMLVLWLKHSQTLRLSVLEKVHKKERWQETVEFIENYGKDLLTQNFLHVGNIRAILHQGVSAWLVQVADSHDPPDLALFKDLRTKLPLKKAAKQLSLILEAVLENFNEYRDYNTTTTQSDSGELLNIFLEFLVLRTKYDRVCWKLNPVIWAHRILVRKQQTNVARMWRRSLKLRVGSEAKRYIALLDTLRKKHSIQMSSVGRRIEGKFGSEMQIDRLTALVKPAMCEADQKQADRAFSMLKQEAQAFSRTTIGVGVDLPPWLAALEHEVQQRLLPVRLRLLQTSQHWGQSRVLPIADIREQLEELPSRNPDGS